MFTRFITAALAMITLVGCRPPTPVTITWQQWDMAYGVKIVPFDTTKVDLGQHGACGFNLRVERQTWVDLACMRRWGVDERFYTLHEEFAHQFAWANHLAIRADGTFDPTDPDTGPDVERAAQAVTQALLGHAPVWHDPLRGYWIAPPNWVRWAQALLDGAHIAHPSYVIPPTT